MIHLFEKPDLGHDRAPSAVGGATGLEYQPAALYTTEENKMLMKMIHFSSGISTAL